MNIRMHLFRKLQLLIKDTRGVSAVLVAFLAIPIFGAIGLAIDTGRAYVLKSKLATALDAAGLAAGRVVFSADDKVKADAQMFFAANFPDKYMDATISPLSITWDASRENITLNVSGTIGTTFMSVMGKHNLTVGAHTVVNRVNRGLELVMVLDNTGSMARDASSGNYGGSVSNRRINVLRDAANDLVDILYGSKEIQKNLWVGIVPYVTQVNVGYDNVHFLKKDERDNIVSSGSSDYKLDTHYQRALNKDVNGNKSNDTSYGWKGCVEMRAHLDGGTKDTTDEPPNSDFVPYLYYNGYINYSYRDWDNDWIPPPYAKPVEHFEDPDAWGYSFNNIVGRGPNAGCPSEVLPLTAEKSKVVARIKELKPWMAGGTMGNIGMVWGWRVISPRWRGQWANSDPTLPKDYNEPLIDKAVIMMTDGENTIFSHGGSGNFDYNSYSRHEKSGYATRHGGYGSTDAYTNADGRLRYTSTSYYRNKIDTKFAQVCQNMKAQGIIVYTIKFKAGNENLYRNCATSPKHFFNSPTTADLKTAFRTIGQQLSNLRISE
jgi:Flp pilus assembly protein TadG